MRWLYDKQPGPRGTNEPCDQHKYISMTETVNKQLSYGMSDAVYIGKHCPHHGCNTVSYKHMHTCVLYCIYTVAEPYAHCKDTCVCVCVCERVDTLTCSF